MLGTTSKSYLGESPEQETEREKKQLCLKWEKKNSPGEQSKRQGKSREHLGKGGKILRRKGNHFSNGRENRKVWGKRKKVQGRQRHHSANRNRVRNKMGNIRKETGKWGERFARRGKSGNMRREKIGRYRCRGRRFITRRPRNRGKDFMIREARVLDCSTCEVVYLRKFTAA